MVEFKDLSIATQLVFAAAAFSLVGICINFLLLLWTAVRPKAGKSTKKRPPGTSENGKILEHHLYINSLKDHRDSVNGFGWAPDGTALATACEDRCVRVFSFADTIDKGIHTRQINIQGTPVDVGFIEVKDKLVVLAKEFLETASLMFYYNEPGELGGTQWNCVKTISKIFKDDKPLMMDVVTNQNCSKTVIVACSQSKEARVFDATGSPLTSFDPNSFVNHYLAVSHNSQLASIATFTSDAKVWELRFSKDGSFRDSNKVMDLRGHRSQVVTVAISMGATRAVSVSQDGVMKIWNLDVQYNRGEDPRCLITRELVLAEGKSFTKLAFGPKDYLAAVIRTSVYFIDLENGDIIERIEDAHDESITALRWCSVSLNSRMGTSVVLASAGRDKKVRLWRHPYDV